MSPIAFLDFDLRVERAEVGYRARLVGSPAGQTVVDFDVPFSPLEVENFLLRIGRPRRGLRRINSPEMQAAKEFGTRLFDAIFTGDMRASLWTSLDAAQQKGSGLRIRLRLNEVPQLADLPWEYLYNPTANRFLVLSVETPIVRYLELQQQIRPLSVTPPLQVLVMISSPTDYPPLDVKAEEAKLREALAELTRNGLVAIDTMEDATLPALQKRLRRRTYHIFHFIGHGGFDRGADDGVLLFEEESEAGRAVSGQYLGTILHDHRPLRLAVLNACEGARSSRSDPFAGVAQSLVQQGIPAVIAMQFEVTDIAAITFAHELYASVADGYPVDAALAEARKAIFAAGNDTEWGTPVLYMRSPDGRIFDVARDRTQPTLVAPKLKRPEPADAERLEKLYTEALSYFYTERWAEAATVLGTIVSVQADYEDAADKLDWARSKERLADLGARAAAALEAGAWGAAVGHLEAIVEIDPHDAQAAARLEETRRRARLAELYGEAKRLTAAEQWEAAVAVIALLREDEPAYADADGIFERAREGLERDRRDLALSGLYAAALRLIAGDRWQEGRDSLEEISALDPGYQQTQALLARARTEIERRKQAELRAEEQAREAERKRLEDERAARARPRVLPEGGLERLRPAHRPAADRPASLPEPVATDAGAARPSSKPVAAGHGAAPPAAIPEPSQAPPTGRPAKPATLPEHAARKPRPEDRPR